jgi:hypothetical protein
MPRLAKNERLRRALAKELYDAQQEWARTGQPARVFKDFTYRTRKSCTRTRRVVGKAEHLADKSNPRFVVTPLPGAQWDARVQYEPRAEHRLCRRVVVWYPSDR